MLNYSTVYMPHSLIFLSSMKTFCYLMLSVPAMRVEENYTLSMPLTREEEKEVWSANFTYTAASAITGKHRPQDNLCYVYPKISRG